VSEHGRPRLAERVDVDDGDEVVERAMAGHLGRLPHGALRGLAVAEQHEHARVASREASAEGQPDPHAETLPQRARCHVHERQTRRRVPLQLALEVAKVGELLALQRPHFRPGRVQHGRGVPLAEHEPIARDRARVIGVESHRVEEDRGDEISRRRRARRMAALGGRRRRDRIDPESSRDVFERLDSTLR
jgi:hypothetical protein